MVAILNLGTNDIVLIPEILINNDMALIETIVMWYFISPY